MKAAIIQFPYSVNYEDADEIFEQELALLDACDASLDLIVLPEYGDEPAVASTYEEHMASRKNYTERLLSMRIDTVLTNDYQRVSKVIK